MTVGVFRITVEDPGEAGNEVLEVVRRHCSVRESGPGEYDAQMHDDMQSGTAIAQIVQVLDREKPGWAEHVSIRPTDDP